MATIEDFRAWYERDLARYAPWGTSVQIIPEEEGAPKQPFKWLRIHIFTDKNRYCIVVYESRTRLVKDGSAQAHLQKLSISEIENIMAAKPGVFIELRPDGLAEVTHGVMVPDRGYLGCIASSRRWRAGEDWHRGSDLPDGPLTEETWRSILAAIVSYELVDVVKEARPGYTGPKPGEMRGFPESPVPQDGNRTA
jgi:hypothetical protein